MPVDAQQPVGSSSDPTSPASGGGGGLKGFLSQKTAGLPNWGWMLAIVLGVAGAYFIPKMLNKGTNASASDSGNPSGTANAGLPDSIDPITGIPYSVEEATNPATGLPAYYGAGVGYTGSGATVGTTIGGILPPVTNPPSPQPGLPPPPPPSPTPSPPAGGHRPPRPGRRPPPVPGPIQPRFVSPARWPAAGSDLSTIARENGTTVAALEAFPENQYIKARGGWNLVYTHDRIRVR